MRVLLVDDSVSTREVFKEMLNELGHSQVLEADDGIDAAALLQREDVDLLITDWDMPHMDGLDLVKSVRGNGDETPIIVVLRRSERSFAITALQAGANSYIIKPCDRTTLTERISQAVESHVD